MSGADLTLAIEWARAEGWNPGRRDADAFYPADPLGFLAGTLDGRMIASISAVRYGAEYGFIGFYIVAREWRGRGFGTRLWQAAMQRLENVACIGLDGVLKEEVSYRKSGFVTAYRNRRYGGRAPASTADAAVTDARTVPFADLAALDRALFPARRDAFLEPWIALDGHRALAMAVDGKLVGFGVARPCVQGFKIGPLYADARTTAERLLRALCAGMGEEPVFLDVPEVNRPAVAFAESLGWTVSFETVRMYRGSAPAVDLKRLYGVTTFELG